MLMMATMAASSGCRPVLPIEAIDGQGVAKTVARDDRFDLHVTGGKCSVVVDQGAVRTLSVTGDDHSVTIGAAVTVEEVSISGNHNRVELADGVTAPQVIMSGNDNLVE